MISFLMKFCKLSWTQKTFASWKANRSVCIVIRHLEHRQPSALRHMGAAILRKFQPFHKCKAGQSVRERGKTGTNKLSMHTSSTFTGSKTIWFTVTDPGINVVYLCYIQQFSTTGKVPRNANKINADSRRHLGDLDLRL